MICFFPVYLAHIRNNVIDNIVSCTSSFILCIIDKINLCIKAQIIISCLYLYSNTRVFQIQSDSNIFLSFKPEIFCIQQIFLYSIIIIELFVMIARSIRFSEFLSVLIKNKMKSCNFKAFKFHLPNIKQHILVEYLLK